MPHKSQHWIDLANAVLMNKKMTKLGWPRYRYITLDLEDGFWRCQEGFLFIPDFNDPSWHILDESKKTPWNNTLETIGELNKKK